MKIGIAGPMTLGLLDFDFRGGTNVPVGYESPMISMLVNALLKRGHEVVAYTNTTDIEQPVVYEDERLTICIGRCRNRHRARDFFALERGQLLELMRKHPAEIINAHWSYEFAWAAMDTGLPVLVTMRDHALSILRYARDPYRFVRLMMNHIVLNRAKYLSTNSEFLYNLLANRHKKKARIIPNFFASNLLDHFLGRSQRSNFILSVSNGFGKWKNIATALQAFSIIKKSHPDIEYHLVGDEMEMGGPAYEYVLKNRISEGVRFIGRLPYDQVVEKTGKALVLLHPSKMESFGMSVLDAMAVGTPVVGGSCSGNIPHLLDNGRAGILCDVDSPKQIAKAILRIPEDVDLWWSLAENGKRFAKENFSEDMTVRAYTKCYHEIVDKERASVIV